MVNKMHLFLTQRRFILNHTFTRFKTSEAGISPPVNGETGWLNLNADLIATFCGSHITPGIAIKRRCENDLCREKDILRIYNMIPLIGAASKPSYPSITLLPRVDYIFNPSHLNRPGLLNWDIHKSISKGSRIISYQPHVFVIVNRLFDMSPTPPPLQSVLCVWRVLLLDSIEWLP